MPNIVVVGAQWGDEGKGKIVDLIAPCVDVVARYQGGPNAGHTVVVGERRYVLQSLPSGVLRPGKRCVIGCGVVVDPHALLEEMAGLAAVGIALDRVYISRNAHVIMPYHKALDQVAEQARIGTTGKGVGPAYADKAARLGIRMGDLADEALLREKIEANLRIKNHLLRGLYGHPGFTVDEVLRTVRAHAERLASHLADTTLLLHQWLAAGASVMFEGAQGTMLDVDHGSYPYITASNASAGGAATGTGVPPTRIHGVLGVTKAYATRVGGGPFPTEVTGDLGELIRARGKEYGSVTGRPRRCGWFDAPLLRHAVRVNGLDAVAVTKLDVLDPCQRVRVAVAYRYRGSRLPELPLEERVLAKLEPVYEERPGWLAPTEGLRAWEDLPGRARDYVSWLQELIGCEICLISTGPARDETILLEPSRLTRWFANLQPHHSPSPPLGERAG
ncbi:MAG: adenylosuccinate synthase [Candidatus Rokubacteria bacterium]|nr:adenylosuccinate synthase [Candidatus Rokubacteria bacterium]